MAAGREIFFFPIFFFLCSAHRALHSCFVFPIFLFLLLSFLSFLLSLNCVQNYGGSDVVVTRVPLCVSRVCVRSLVVRLLGQAPDILTFIRWFDIQKSKGNTKDASIIRVIMKRFVVLDLVVTLLLPRHRPRGRTTTSLGKEKGRRRRRRGGALEMLLKKIVMP